jgi:hypothetical protein
VAALVEWGPDWSDEKKDWCCERWNVHGFLRYVPAAQLKYCCDHKGVACPISTSTESSTTFRAAATTTADATLITTSALTFMACEHRRKEWQQIGSKSRLPASCCELWSVLWAGSPTWTQLHDASAQEHCCLTTGHGCPNLGALKVTGPGSPLGASASSGHLVALQRLDARVEKLEPLLRGQGERKSSTMAVVGLLLFVGSALALVGLAARTMSRCASPHEAQRSLQGLSVRSQQVSPTSADQSIALLLQEAPRTGSCTSLEHLE